MYVFESTCEQSNGTYSYAGFVSICHIAWFLTSILCFDPNYKSFTFVRCFYYTVSLKVVICQFKSVLDSINLLLLHLLFFNL